ncbi:MAG: hypothetical protein NTZ56_22890 [Acidobacteria bacterium]|nr:hypothetical protein [Acidobacteriota bacterium]
MPLLSLMITWWVLELSGLAYPLRAVATANPFIRAGLLCGLSVGTASLALWLLDRRGDRAQRTMRRLRAGLAALCLAPFAALISAHSPVLLAAGGLLAVALTWLVLAEHPGPKSPAALGGADRPLFDLHSARTLRQSPLPALALAIAGHAAAGLLLTGRLKGAAWLLVASLVASAWWLSVLREIPPPPPRAFHQQLLILAAVLMTFLGVLPPGRWSGIMGLDPARAEASPTPPPQEAAGRGSARAGESSEGGTHDGVIILPEEEPHTVLVPPLPALRPNLFHSPDQEPLSIPFFGVYWLFKFPDRRPPPGSMVKRGTPETLKFRSTDWRPLILEGRQNLGQSIDVSCCSRIEMDISNADIYPGTVQAALTLIDTASPGQPGWKLPRAPVTSFRGFGSEAAVPETLVFPFASQEADRPLVRFDELHIRFQLDHGRAHASPRMAIRRFRLVPRGR